MYSALDVHLFGQNTLTFYCSKQIKGKFHLFRYVDPVKLPPNVPIMIEIIEILRIQIHLPLLTKARQSDPTTKNALKK